MRRVTCRACSALLLVGLAAACDGAVEVAIDAAADPAEAAWQATLARARTWIAEKQVPGMALAVVVNGAPRFADGVGVRRWGGTEPVTADTRTYWLSVTKLHTATAAMRLLEAGDLDLDAPVTGLVPELRLAGGADASAITTRHLLAHTSGLPTMVPYYDGICARTLAEVWGSWMPALRSPPGAIFVYNNFAAYSLAGLVVERAAGRPFDVAVEDLVFAPAGMVTATFDPREVVAVEHASGTTRSGGTVTVHDIDPTWTICPVELGPGGMAATARDVSRMIAIQLADGAPLLAPASAAAMRDQVDTHATPDGESRYGLGMYRRIHHGTELLEVWAWGGGYRGQVVMAPALGWGIAVGTNAEWASPGEVALEALDLFFPALPDEDPDFTTDPATWTRYTGVYHDASVYGDVTVELRDGELHARPTFPAQEWRLQQLAGDYFEVVLADGSRLGVQFIARDGCGQTEWFTTFGQPGSPTWPPVPLGVARRTVAGCRGVARGADPGDGHGP